LNHLWQRFLLASSLLVGLAIGVGATVFGYSNLTTVDVRWSVFHLDNIPLWSVAVVPITLILIAGTIYHWMDGLHHFTEHMRHRHRVHELELEVSRLRAHLDQVLEMPDHRETGLKSKISLPPSDAAADLAMSELQATEIDSQAEEPEADHPERKPESTPPKPARGDRRKRARLTNVDTKPNEQPAPHDADGAEPAATTAEPAAAVKAPET
jgi:hypothetical protein